MAGVSPESDYVTIIHALLEVPIQHSHQDKMLSANMSSICTISSNAYCINITCLLPHFHIRMWRGWWWFLGLPNQWPFISFSVLTFVILKPLDIIEKTPWCDTKTNVSVPAFVSVTPPHILRRASGWFLARSTNLVFQARHNVFLTLRFFWDKA